MKIHTMLGAGLLSLGCMALASDLFGQGETPNAVDSKAGYGSAFTSPARDDTKIASTASGAASGSVEVKLTEFKIEMTNSIVAGSTTVKVTNIGKETHGFEIEGNGIEKAINPKLKQGESGSLLVDLKPGSYKVYCPVKGHKMLGMSLALTVK